MIITVKRKWQTDESTQGELYVDGVFECYTLEDVERSQKVAGETAIPKGSYKVIINQSPRFGRLMPLITDVPGFSGVRIHSGNTAADTEGCLLVGKTRGPDFIGRSREAYLGLFSKLLAANEANNPITIIIEDCYE